MMDFVHECESEGRATSTISRNKSQNIFLQSFSEIITQIFFYKVFLQRILLDLRSRRKDQRWIKLSRKHDGLRPRMRVRRTSSIDHFKKQIPKYISTKYFWNHNPNIFLQSFSKIITQIFFYKGSFDQR